MRDTGRLSRDSTDPVLKDWRPLGGVIPADGPTKYFRSRVLVVCSSYGDIGRHSGKRRAESGGTLR